MLPHVLIQSQSQSGVSSEVVSLLRVTLVDTVDQLTALAEAITVRWRNGVAGGGWGAAHFAHFDFAPSVLLLLALAVCHDFPSLTHAIVVRSGRGEAGHFDFGFDFDFAPSAPPFLLFALPTRRYFFLFCLSPFPSSVFFF